ncbi:uncharacterized protein L201_001289 [Kwoniella dendrophila CBS 6074]|uniref:MARVEL domain-containing protein n=1 Tax=Kwoniella dendrophila CBS 6074 TaxID=1295534 RepID=A0AAX4JNK9_9TREE
MARSAPVPGGSTKTHKPRPTLRQIFSTSRQIFYACFFILWFCIDVAELGLVSEQIHKYGGRESVNWPTGKYGHAIGLLLFSTIIGLLFGIFHWFVGLTMYLPIFLAMGVWFGTGAGILEETPFGHGLQCKHKNDPSRFPEAFRPYLSECSRITAMEGLAWAMFALSVIGFFFAFFDKFSLTAKRSIVYESLAEEGHAEIPEKH